MGILKGQLEYQKFLRNESLTRKQAILAQCYVCNGEEESNEDCKGKSCPLYQYHPYRGKHKPKSGKSAILSIFLWALLSLITMPAVADTASWYSESSCKKEGTWNKYDGLTASGERYDETALTCAMRSREWGARYRVTNLDNGKSVICRLNDFGPNKKLWDKGRKCDLSPAAFSQIADLKRGVISVKIEKL